MTNAEKLARNTETLADLIVQNFGLQCCNYCAYCYEECRCDCNEGVKKWLEQEAKDD